MKQNKKAMIFDPGNHLPFIFIVFFFLIALVFFKWFLLSSETAAEISADKDFQKIKTCRELIDSFDRKVEFEGQTITLLEAYPYLHAKISPKGCPISHPWCPNFAKYMNEYYDYNYYWSVILYQNNLKQNTKANIVTLDPTSFLSPKYKVLKNPLYDSCDFFLPSDKENIIIKGKFEFNSK